MREVAIGNAIIAFHEGQLEDVPVEAICCGANAQGIMASGHAGRLRLFAGAEVERELRAQVPLLVGEAYVTGPGRAENLGATRIVHFVSNDAPGAPVQRAALERGLDGALEILDRAKVRSISVPDVGLRIANSTVDGAAAILAHALARRLRRGTTLERITIASQDSGYLTACRTHLLALGATEP